MKASEFKTIIKESVREVIQEELKEILLEALRAPKSQVVAESKDTPLTNKPSASGVEKRAIMENIMGDMNVVKIPYHSLQLMLKEWVVLTKHLQEQCQVVTYQQVI
jgi:hypothetical protein